MRLKTEMGVQIVCGVEKAVVVLSTFMEIA